MTEHTPQFRLVVFDVAGTTVLDGDAVVDCMKAVIGTRADVSSQDVRDVMGLPKPLAIGVLLSSATPLRDEALREAVEESHRAFRAALVARYREDGVVTPAPGALSVFSALRRADIRVALDTGFSRDILDTVLSQLGWAEGVIDCSIASDEVERGRPHPDMIQRAMSLSGVTSPGQVAKVGDTPSDILEGLAAGCGLVVGVTCGTHSRSQLEREGVHTIDRLQDVLPLLNLEPV
jgi:phosphonatase-like hydrolase